MRKDRATAVKEKVKKQREDYVTKHRGRCGRCTTKISRAEVKQRFFWLTSKGQEMRTPLCPNCKVEVRKSYVRRSGGVFNPRKK